MKLVHEDQNFNFAKNKNHSLCLWLISFFYNDLSSKCHFFFSFITFITYLKRKEDCLNLFG